MTSIGANEEPFQVWCFPPPWHRLVVLLMISIKQHVDDDVAFHFYLCFFRRLPLKGPAADSSLKLRGCIPLMFNKLHCCKFHYISMAIGTWRYFSPFWSLYYGCRMLFLSPQETLVIYGFNLHSLRYPLVLKMCSHLDWRPAYSAQSFYIVEVAKLWIAYPYALPLANIMAQRCSPIFSKSYPCLGQANMLDISSADCVSHHLTLVAMIEKLWKGESWVTWESRWENQAASYTHDRLTTCRTRHWIVYFFRFCVEKVDRPEHHYPLLSAKK